MTLPAPRVPGTYRILFVCMGNICRSPAGEGVLAKILQEAGLADRVRVDSAGTLGYKDGHPADGRICAAAARRGYTLTSKSRRVQAADLEQFDLLVAMDRDHLFHLHAMDPAGLYRDRIKLMLEFSPTPSKADVPDPYTEGEAAFEHVLDLIEPACSQLCSLVQAELA